ncbi:MAG TPA: alpha,alpha-trehalase TreF [Bacteroidota bacterium]|nr:alpha,alpha-trehalase TreF [Bacteroidota bacterium]
MTRSLSRKISLVVLVLLLATRATVHPASPKQRTLLPPEELYGQLFYDIQSNKNIFSDSKTFVDCFPRYNVKTILEKYARLHRPSDSVLSIFIKENFFILSHNSSYVTDSSSINEHITKLWAALKRPPDKKQSGTLIPLPYPYIVPGGRFREIYYWDSYFTMLGLQADHQTKIVQDMVDNFSYLIARLGFIPNGNRTYYLSRSQPPFYAMMISILASIKGDSVYAHYLPYMEREYAFWMDGTDSLHAEGESYRRVVMLPGREILNRYWDDKNTPRPESYRQDVATAQEAAVHSLQRNPEEVFRNLRAAAESGWDFSSRWLSVDSSQTFKLYTVHTTDMIPVDLNALLCNLEYTISHACIVNHDTLHAKIFMGKYQARKKAIMKYCWDEHRGFFMDFDFKTNTRSSVYSLAGMFPLFFHLASQEQAASVARIIQELFLKPGGAVTTLNNTGQQWDAPNGWAPLQWMTICGLRNYGYDSLAKEIKLRWLTLNRKVYRTTYKMLEKYNVEDLSLKGGGGEYPNQDGFGWTNGVYQKLSKER